MSEQQKHPIEGLMDVTLQRIKEMVDVNTIIGDPITTDDGTTIIPVSKVSYGFASGGTDIPSKNAVNKQVFGGGGGAGVTIKPMAFIVVSNGNTQLLNLESCDDSLGKLADLIPEVIDKIVSKFSKKKNDNTADTDEASDI